MKTKLKKFKNMTDKELATAKTIASVKPKSQFFMYCNVLSNYDLYLKGYKVYKFEAWHSNYRDAKAIIKGNSIIKCKLKEHESTI